MHQENWGLLGPERLASNRRTRTLGLGAVVREFNELAVPGLGGIWFGKQVMLATLGLLVAESARERGAKLSNIEVTNAVEALACWSSFNRNSWASDGRLRGRTKLQRRKRDDLGFSRVRQRSFYVTQPMRMSTALALPSLGFAVSDGSRFNSFRSTEAGSAFIERACEGYRPFNRTVLEHLTKWTGAGANAVGVDSGSLVDALSPLTALPVAANRMLVEGLRHDHLGRPEVTQRRASALDWVEHIRAGDFRQSDSTKKPAALGERHWSDINEGARFFAVRDAAIRVLDVMESVLGGRTGRPAFHLKKEALPAAVVVELEALAHLAETFLSASHEQPEAAIFCEVCRSGERDTLRTLATLDGSVLRLSGEEIVPGPAFSGTNGPTRHAVAEDSDAPPDSLLPFPDGVSHRVGNLYRLNLDIHGQLEKWLAAQRNGGGR